jgi:hypothetical protein
MAKASKKAKASNKGPAANQMVKARLLGGLLN